MARANAADSKREASVARADCRRARAGDTKLVSRRVEISLGSALKWHRWGLGQRSDSFIVKAAPWPLCRECIIKEAGQEGKPGAEGIAVIQAGRQWLRPEAELWGWRQGLFWTDAEDVDKGLKEGLDRDDERKRAVFFLF